MKHLKSLLLVCLSFIAIIAFSACGGGGGGGDAADGSPAHHTGWSKDQIKNQIIKSNLQNPHYQDNAGRISRWKTPIPVNTNGIERADEAVARFNQLTHGVVNFVYVDEIPKNGIIFVVGGAINADGSPGCGNVNNNTGTNHGALYGLYTIHLGSVACDDSYTDGVHRKSASAIAEHELAHALGVGAHFDGFTGDEGLSPNLLAVIYNLYTNPIGARADELVITFP